MKHTRRTAANTLFRLLCLSLTLAILAPLCLPLLNGAAAQIGRPARRGTQIKAGSKLGKNLPDLSGVRHKKEAQPSAPTFDSTARACSDCGAQNAAGDAFSAARLDPANRTGQPAIDLLSRNFNWSKSLVDLPGRNKLDFELALVYNSLVWTKAGQAIAFDADRGQPSPGFRLGFPVVQPRFRDARSGKLAYIMIGTDGARTELRQVGDSNVYEATDDSLLQLVDNGANGAVLRRPDGTQLSLRQLGGQLQVVEVKDRNGNFITASYNKRGHLSNVTDTLGRQISFDRDNGGKLISITHKENGQKRRVLATFGYSDITIQTNFAGLSVVGTANGSAIAALTQVGLPDGSSYKFDYTSYGQVARITRNAADGHALAYDAYDVPQDAAAPLADAPRPTGLRMWAEGSNNDAEAATRFESDSNGAWGLATLPDGSTRKEFFAAEGIERGLVTRVEERNASGQLLKSSETEYASQSIDDVERIVVRERRTQSVDPKGNSLRSRTVFTATGFPSDVYDYAGDAGEAARHTHFEYNEDPAYTKRHVFGLIKEQITYNAAGAVVTKITSTYDEQGSLVGNTSPVQHDGINFGAELLTGRGLLTAVRKWDAQAPNDEARATETRFGFNTTGTVAYTRAADGRQTNVSYTDDFSDGKGRNTQAFATSAVHPNGSRTYERFDYDTGKPVWTKNAKGEAHAFKYDHAGRMTGRVNQQTGASVRRHYDANGTLVANFTKVNATTKEFGSYTVTDGKGRTRARAFDPLSAAMGYRGVIIERDSVGRAVGHTKMTKMTSSWVALEPTVIASSGKASAEPSGVAETAVASARQFGESVVSGLGSLLEAVEPSANAQDCYSDYYGNQTCYDTYNNDWFYGDQWGYDWYWDWTDFSDALIFDNDDFWFGDGWDSLAYLAGLSDRELDIQIQFSSSGYFQYAYDVEWNGHGYSGTLPLWAVDSLYGDPNFADGFLYGFHTDVGRDLVDFRSYTGSFGDGSLQIVVDQTTGRFHTDVDRFNPYQDVVNFFGHTFGEVLPNFFRRIF